MTHDMEKPIQTASATESDSEPANNLEDVVDFAPHDALDPLTWSDKYKWSIVLVLSLLSAFVQLATVIAAPVAPQIERAFQDYSATSQTLIVTIWELGEVVGPLLYGPLSEHFGRLPVLHITNAIFVAFSIGCACSTSMSMLITMRFLNGVSVAIISVSGGLIGDLFIKEHRGPALSLMMIGSQIGPALGPIIGGYLGEAKGWRWPFWLTAILTGALSLVFLIVYREMYRVKLLERKTRALRKSTGNDNLKSVYSFSGEKSTRNILTSVFRPLYLITHSWILAGITLYISICLGLFYLALTSIASTFEQIYGFTQGQAGLAYLGLFLGMTFGCVYFNIASRRPARAKASSSAEVKVEMKPEERLVPSTVAGFIMSSGFFLYGWTLQYRVHWMAPIIGTSLIGLGYFVMTVSVRSFIIDAFGIYAVSASAAMLAGRNATAAVLPLAGPPLFARLGEGWACTVLGFSRFGSGPHPSALCQVWREAEKVVIVDYTGIAIGKFASRFTKHRSLLSQSMGMQERIGKCLGVK